MGAVMGGSSAVVVSVLAYDSMLHRDSQFWDVIAMRREENMRRKEAAEGRRAVGTAAGGGAWPGDAVVGAEGGDEIDNDAPLYGPTIGRRRNCVARGAGGLRDDKAEGRGGGGKEQDWATPQMPRPRRNWTG